MKTQREKLLEELVEYQAELIELLSTVDVIVGNSYVRKMERQDELRRALASLDQDGKEAITDEEIMIYFNKVARETAALHHVVIPVITRGEAIAMIRHFESRMQSPAPTVDEKKIELNEFHKLIELLKGDSIYWLLRFGVKSPSQSGMDNCEDSNYYELYQLVCELRNPTNLSKATKQAEK